MGDLSSLLEKVRSATDENATKKLEERLSEGKFTRDDLYSQLEQMNKMGSMDKVLSMVPGMGNIASKVSKTDLNKQEKKMKSWKNAISSMTPYEKENPEILEKQTSRISRVAKGSGSTTSDVRMLLKQYKMLKEMMNMQSAGALAEGKMDKRTMQKMAKQFKGKIKF